MLINSDHQNSVALQPDSSSIRGAKRFINLSMKLQSFKMETYEP